MLDKNVGDALLRLDLTPQTDPPSAQIERIIETDHRRVKRWTRIAIALWILAALGGIVISVMGALTFPMIAKMVMEEKAANAKATAGKTTDVAVAARRADESKNAERQAGTLEEPDTPFLLLAKLVAMTFAFGSLAFLVLILAGLATVLLLLRSRTATFRQINANLLQIADQLRRVPPGATSAGGGTAMT